MSNAPRIVCITGSSRFADAAAVLAWEEEKRGRITLRYHYLPGWYALGDHLAEREGVAATLDALSLAKVDLADELLVCDVGGYVGASTRADVARAEARGIPVRYVSRERPHFPADLTQDCPGAGRCHGSMSWCANCGDVGRVCDMGGLCDQHRPGGDRDLREDRGEWVGAPGAMFWVPKTEARP